jgi:hypothetical protein
MQMKVSITMTQLVVYNTPMVNKVNMMYLSILPPLSLTQLTTLPCHLLYTALDNIPFKPMTLPHEADMQFDLPWAMKQQED